MKKVQFLLFSFKNSGLFQGLLLKRHRVPLREPLLGDRAYWHWTDLKVGEFWGKGAETWPKRQIKRDFSIF